MQFVERFRHYLGWCPNSRVVSTCTPVMKGELAGFPEPQGQQPESAIEGTIKMLDWFTTVAIIILFATLFVGGNFWWPAVVLAIVAIGIAVVDRPKRSSREA